VLSFYFIQKLLLEEVVWNGKKAALDDWSRVNPSSGVRVNPTVK